MNLQSSAFPNYEAYWLTVNGLALILITLGLRGHCERTQCGTLPDNLWPYAGVVFVGVVWATVFSPHLGIRTALVPASATVSLIMAALMVIRHREKPRAAEWAAAMSMLIFGVLQGVAAGMALLQGAAGDAVYQSLYTHYNFLTLPAGYMATGMFVILMLASDLSEDMKRIAVHDQLTNVLNRRGLGEQGAAAYATARRTGRAVSVIMTDIDRFKSINDRFGHSVGDLALVHFCNILKEARRGDDIIARVGGEEFALILPGTNLEEAIELAESLCRKVDDTPMCHDDQQLSMTASFGVATISNRDMCLSDTVSRADRALYRSKRAGRNQVDLESSSVMRAEDGTLKPVTV